MSKAQRDTKICPECAHEPHPSGLRWAASHPEEATHCRDCGAKLMHHGTWSHMPECPCSRAECVAACAAFVQERWLVDIHTPSTANTYTGQWVLPAIDDPQLGAIAYACDNATVSAKPRGPAVGVFLHPWPEHAHSESDEHVFEQQRRTLEKLYRERVDTWQTDRQERAAELWALVEAHLRGPRRHERQLLDRIEAWAVAYDFEHQVRLVVNEHTGIDGMGWRNSLYHVLAVAPRSAVIAALKPVLINAPNGVLTIAKSWYFAGFNVSARIDIAGRCISDVEVRFNGAEPEPRHRWEESERERVRCGVIL